MRGFSKVAEELLGRHLDGEHRQAALNLMARLDELVEEGLQRGPAFRRAILRATRHVLLEARDDPEHPAYEWTQSLGPQIWDSIGEAALPWITNDEAGRDAPQPEAARFTRVKDVARDFLLPHLPKKHRGNAMVFASWLNEAVGKAKELGCLNHEFLYALEKAFVEMALEARRDATSPMHSWATRYLDSRVPFGAE